MEFSIDIQTKLNGEVILNDYSRDFYQYIKEDTEVVTTFDQFKYSQSISLNILSKVSIKNEEVINAVFVEHDLEVDESYKFKVIKDGYYKINHMVLPTVDWWNNASDDNKEYFETIYFVDNNKIYKVVDNVPEECSLEEIIERNPENSTISQCFINIFYTGNLLQCYVNYSKRVFDSQVCGCPTENNDIYIRDFLWMSLNIIDYLISFDQFIEAQRMLEQLSTCNGFCNSISSNVFNSQNCGCSKM